MPEFSITRARTFLKEALKAPLFEQIREPLVDDSVVQAKTLKQLEKALSSNERFWIGQSDHHTGMILEVYGWDWFQEHNNACVDAVQAEIDKTDLAARIDEAWARVELPEILGVFTNTKQCANNWFRMIGYDYGLDFDETRSFERCFVEPWLMRGRFPCGWKGKPQRKANLKNIRNPWEGVTVEDFAGDGRLIVF